MGGDVLICGANFTGADIKRVSFEGAIYDEATIFPIDFNPVARGLKKQTAG